MTITLPSPVPQLPVVHGERLTLRPGAPADASALVELLADPAVMEYWGRNPLERVREELATLTTWIIEVGGAVAGWLQVHEEPTPEFRHVAFDIAVATAFQGNGYGQESLRTAIRHFAGQGHHRFTIDPRADNERAIRSYEAIGFRRVGILRRAEQDLDGHWRDGLLLDALADELDWL